MLRNDLLSAFARPPVQLEPTHGFSAVAAIFDGHRELLLIRRSERPGDPWSGHLSFPGGRVEPTDLSPLHAALRETAEETGLVLREGTLLGQLDDLAAVGGKPGMVIRPFVFLDEALDLRTLARSFRPNAEVAALCSISLQALLADHGRSSMPFERQGTRYTLPCVDVEGQRLWGLTLRMVDDLLHRLDGRGVGLARIRELASG